MMDTILQLVALLAVVLGTFFSVVGMLGFIRFPDVYSRLHAAGKVGVFGVVLLLVAAVAWTPLAWGKAAVLIVLLMISGPVITHAISSAAYRIGLPLKDSVCNELPLVEFDIVEEE